ncbi:MAG: hypothetical protein SGI73_22330, partial [Chloroflexota bacterium]|nr:hypothetical protein [Chloroflexota bacterium]
MPNWTQQGEILSYALPVNNYNALRRVRNYSHILVVLIVPSTPSDGLEHAEERTILRYGAYCHSLRTEPEKPNKNTITVQIPRIQIFSAQTLVTM